MIYLNQNLFPLERQGVRENCILFIICEQRGNALNRLHDDFIDEDELSYKDFRKIGKKVWKAPYNYLVFVMSKNKYNKAKLKINWESFIV